MADAQMNGHWKGLAVFRRLHSEVDFYFEQTDMKLTGTFEAQDVEVELSKGVLTGSIDAGNKVYLSVPDPISLEFYGELTGAGSHQGMLFGALTSGDLPVGTLTLFHNDAGDATILRY